MTFRFDSPNPQFLDANGVPLAGGMLYFYESGTSTPQNTYQDSGLTTPNTNPVVLDSAGRCGNIFLIQGALYKVVLTDLNNAQQWTVDPVSDPTSGGGTFNGFLAVNGAAGSTRNVEFQTSGVNRFILGLTADPETGSNAGSNIIGSVCADNGSILTNVFTINRSTGVWTWLVSPKSSQQPTQTSLLSGSAATYTPPTGVARLRVRMYGGGGGGGGCGSGSPGAGGAGGTTSFGAYTAIGGAGGSPCATLTGGAGGTGGSGGAGSAFVRMQGNNGSGAVSSYASGTTIAPGLAGNGGAGVFGGVGTSSYYSGGTINAAANSGSGGAGGASTAGGFASGGGGGAGEYAEMWINTPAASYTYTVGTGGAAGIVGTGSGAGNAGTGGAGAIFIEEFYS